MRTEEERDEIRRAFRAEVDREMAGVRAEAAATGQDPDGREIEALRDELARARADHRESVADLERLVADQGDEIEAHRALIADEWVPLIGSRSDLNEAFGRLRSDPKFLERETKARRIFAEEIEGESPRRWRVYIWDPRRRAKIRARLRRVQSGQGPGNPGGKRRPL